MPKFVYVVSRRVYKMEAACKQGKGPDEANQRHQPTKLWDRKIMMLEDILGNRYSTRRPSQSKAKPLKEAKVPLL